MDEFKPNSNRFKEKQKEATQNKPQKIVTGQVIRKPRKSISAATNGIISDDAGNVWKYIWKDTLLPAGKKLLCDMLNEGLNIIFYGSSSRPEKRSTSDRVSYNSYSESKKSRFNSCTVNRYTVDDIIIPNRGEAESVLDTLDEMLYKYGIARVADFYDLVGITGNFTDNNYGWKNLSGASIVRTRDGYRISFPPAVPLE